MSKLLASVGLALMLVVAMTAGVFAVDYSSAVTTAGASVVADLTPTLAAVAVIGLGVIALFIGLKVAFKGFRKVG